MNDIKVIIWLFPILFMFHDFEEIIFMKPWISKNRHYLSEKFPRLAKKMLSHFDNITTSAFAMGVAEEFIFISVITIYSYFTNWYDLWMGLFIAFTLHLIIHCLQALIVRRYVPVLATSIICLPACIYIIMNTANLIAMNSLIFYSVISVVFLIVNVALIHRAMIYFCKWQASYEKY